MHNDDNYAMYKRTQTCKTHKERLQTWTHYTFTVSHMQSALSLFHTEAPTKQTSTQMRHYKLKIPLLPLVVERMQKWPTKWSLLCI